MAGGRFTCQNSEHRDLAPRQIDMHSTSRSSMIYSLLGFILASGAVTASTHSSNSAPHLRGDPETKEFLATAATADTTTTVKVVFYGEAQCPYCRKFVTDIWPKVWDDLELRSFVDYDFIPWGNAYFATDECGKGPQYNPAERHCWSSMCFPESKDGFEDNANDCFSGEPIHQHSVKEGQVDIYETCVKEMYGMETAVDFMLCCEGDFMETMDSAKDLMKQCTPTLEIAAGVEECLEVRGKQLEIQNAKATPDHPGVPFVMVDGEALDDPFSVKDAICAKLANGGTAEDDLPKACQTKQMEPGIIEYS
jgi:hypothetical protein